MNECKREGCNRPVTGKALYCSCTRRNKASRSRASVSPSVSLPSVSLAEYVTVEGKCYGRPAVECPEFGTRPEPLDHTDQPFPKNRGRYTRTDGSVYMFDAGGQVFECKHPFKDKYGKPHLAVYETAADVREAAGACL